MSPSSWSWRWPSLLLAPGLGRAPFDDPGEGQHAEIARELLGGSWLTLRLNGVRYFDKPPLLYWLTAASFHAVRPDRGRGAPGPAAGRRCSRSAATALLGVRLLGPGGGAAGRPRAAVLRAVRRRSRGTCGRKRLFVARRLPWGFTGTACLAHAGAQNGPRTPPAADNRSGAGWAVRRLRGARGRGAREGSARAGRAARGHRDRGGAGGAAAAGARVAAAARSGAHGRHRLRLVRGGRADRARVSLVHGGGQPRAERRAHAAVPRRGRAALRARVPHRGGLRGLSVDPGGRGDGGRARSRARLARSRRSCRGWPWPCGRWACWRFFTVSPFKLPHYGLPAYPALALLAARALARRRRRARAG